jgi:hypothetical protein
LASLNQSGQFLAAVVAAADISAVAAAHTSAVEVRILAAVHALAVEHASAPHRACLHLGGGRRFGHLSPRGQASGRQAHLFAAPID